MTDISPLQDAPDFMRLFIALISVLGLMVLFAFVMKKLGLAQSVKLKSTDKPRLKIVESLPLDARRRAVILRRDDVEHLIILNTNGETVVERSISVPVDSSGNDTQQT